MYVMHHEYPSHLRTFDQRRAKETMRAYAAFALALAPSALASCFSFCFSSFFSYSSGRSALSRASHSRRWFSYHSHTSRPTPSPPYSLSCSISNRSSSSSSFFAFFFFFFLDAAPPPPPSSSSSRSSFVSAAGSGLASGARAVGVASSAGGASPAAAFFAAAWAFFLA